MNGWLVTLADGRRFAWTESDDVHSAREARDRLHATDPGALIMSVEQEEILEEIVLNVSEN